MPVLKAQQVQQKVRESAIVMDLSDLEREAGRIVAQAKAQAARMVAEARAQAEQEAAAVREEARRAGHAEGYQAGQAEGRQQGHDEAAAAAQAQLRELAGRWGQTLELLHQHMPVHVAEARTDLIKLALAIAARVTRQEALKNRQVAAAVVEDALRLVGTARQVAVHVSPAEMELLEGYLPDLLATLRSIESVALTPDETVGEGGCVLRFGAGEVDARLETQLARIEEELVGLSEADGEVKG